MDGREEARLSIVSPHSVPHTKEAAMNKKPQSTDLRKSILLCCVLAVFSISTAAGHGGSMRDTLTSPRHAFHHEIPGDQFVPVERDGMPTSPAYRIATPGFFSVQVNVDSLGRNIVGDAANEPSIAVDPTNPNRMVIGWRQFNIITSNFRQAGYGYTTNGGTTWNIPLRSCARL
jgi:hypothetical protein